MNISLNGKDFLNQFNKDELIEFISRNPSNFAIGMTDYKYDLLYIKWRRLSKKAEEFDFIIGDGSFDKKLKLQEKASNFYDKYILDYFKKKKGLK